MRFRSQPSSGFAIVLALTACSGSGSSSELRPSAGPAAVSPWYASFTVNTHRSEQPVPRVNWVISWDRQAAPVGRMGRFGLMIADTLRDSLLPLPTRLDNLVGWFYWRERTANGDEVVRVREPALFISRTPRKLTLRLRASPALTQLVGWRPDSVRFDLGAAAAQGGGGPEGTAWVRPRYLP